MWRWRYPFESYDYDRFWTRVIRYLGEARLLGTQKQVSVSTDRRSYNPGQNVEITLRVLDPALFSQLSGQSVYVTITAPGGAEYKLLMNRDPREPFYRANYRARSVGAMEVTARHVPSDADTEARPLFDVSTSFQVKLQSLEDVDTSADLDRMKELADETKGMSLDHTSMDQLDKLIASIPTDPQIRSQVRTKELLDMGPVLYFLFLFLVLICTEWCLRKWWGLL
jgi:hypothetical protein